MNKKQAWLELCIKHNLKLYGRDAKVALTCYCLGKGILKTIQEDGSLGAGIDNECEYCKKPIKTIEEAEAGSGYWSPRWIKYHKTCKHLKKENEIEQQKIDCSCNYCVYLERKGKLAYCTKKGINVIAVSNYCQAFENDKCFKHRNEE